MIGHLMKYRIIITALVLSLVLVSFGCAKQGARNSELSVGQLKILSHSMTVHEFTGGAPQSTAVVRGRAQNIGSASIGSAMIAVNFYDKNRNQIATASAVKQNLQPGETWDFSVQTVGPDAWKIISYDIAASMK